QPVAEKQRLLATPGARIGSVARRRRCGLIHALPAPLFSMAAANSNREAIFMVYRASLRRLANMRAMTELFRFRVGRVTVRNRFAAWDFQRDGGMVGNTGIEPVTFPMSRGRSPAELIARVAIARFRPIPTPAQGWPESGRGES